MTMPWFKRSDGYTVLVPDWEDTIERLLREGWVEVPAPAPAREPERAATPQGALTPPPAARAVLENSDDTPPPAPKRVPARKAPVRATAKVQGRKKGSPQTARERATRIQPGWNKSGGE